MFLGTVTMLFAAFASAYIVRRSGTDWQHVALPSVLWWNTFVLAMSSGVLETAARYGRQRRWTLARAAFAAAFVLGLAFVAGQISAWRAARAAGIYLPVSGGDSVPAGSSVSGLRNDCGDGGPAVSSAMIR